MQKNNHARSRQKRRKLRLKNLFIKIFRTKCEKEIKANRPVSEHGSALVRVHHAQVQFETLRRHQRMGVNITNQRQKRKRLRQVPQLRNK